MSELKNNNSGGKEISEKKEKKDSGTPSKKEKKTKSKKFKIPSLFKKKYRVKKFEKKILKKLYVPGDRNFVAENFNYTELSEPEKKDKKTRVFFTGKALKTKSDENRLKQLSKEIKKQHGTVKLLPLGLFLLVCIGIFGFFLIFGNLIVEKVLVSSLEGIFGAKAEVSNVRLSLPSSLLKLDRITVANKDAPMYNLFEVEGVKLEFNLLELSRKKVDIEDFTISGIQWGTKRTVSGALPEKERLLSFPEPLPREIRGWNLRVYRIFLMQEWVVFRRLWKWMALLWLLPIAGALAPWLNRFNFSGIRYISEIISAGSVNAFFLYKSNKRVTWFCFVARKFPNHCNCLLVCHIL